MNSKKINKALSIGLCAAALVPSVVSAKEFKDVKQNGGFAWAYEYIDELSDKGIIDGYPNGNFEPDRPVSLEETFQLLKGIINPSSSEIKDAVSKYGSLCDDMGVSSWAKEPISVALSRGIITDYDLKQAKDKDLLGPKRTTYPDRNTVSVYFAKGLNLSESGDESLLKHNDKNSIPNVTKGYLASLVKAGIFDATGSNGYFKGDRHIRRSEMAKITKLSYDHAKNVGIDLEEKTIDGKVILATTLNNLDTIITEKDNKRSQFRVDSSTIYKMKDKTVSFKDIKPEQEVKITYVKNGDDTVTGLAKKIEIINSEKNLIGYVTDSTSDSFTVKYKEYDKDKLETTEDKIKTTDNAKFKLEKDAKIYKYGKKINEKDLKVDDIIEFATNADGDVKEAYVYPEKGSVTGKITDITEGTSSKRETITLKLDDDKKYTFYGKKNKDKDSDNPFYSSKSDSLFKDLKEGREVTLQLNYKIVTKIGKENTSDYVLGKITEAKEYDKSERGRIGYIKIETNKNREEKYYITKDTKFKDDTSSAKNPQRRIEDLKGETVKLVLDGDDIETLTKIDKNSAIDAVAQIVRTKTDDKGYQKEYTIKILDKGYGNVSRGDKFTFKTENDFDKWEVIRITGQMYKGDLEEIYIEHIEYEDEELDRYNDFNYSASKKSSNDYKIKWS